MTVWGVNTAAAVAGVHRHFASLREAVPDILAFARPEGAAGAG
jgi:sugar-phosphatase